MKKGNKAQIAKVAKQALETLKQLEAMKPLYGQMDQLTAQLIDLGVDSVEVGGTKLVVVDNFAIKNTVFKTTSVKRFELKVG